MPTKTLRIDRLIQIVRFLRVSRLLLWTIWVMYRERRRLVLAHARGSHAPRPERDALIEVLVAFRERALELGFLMIKLGQFLSSRADLLPQKALGILSSLQDDVPPAPFDHVVSVIESELGKPVEEVFSILERKCTAAASLGQVHKAILAATGEMVAVKIQRPNSDRLVRTDLRALSFVIWIMTRFVDVNQFIDLKGVYYEFERTVYEEIDYVREAANAKRFQAMFKDNPMISIPRIYDEYVSRRLLVLEWIDGIKINDYAALDAAGINRLEVARRTVCAYFHQFFEAGFFHADPHPGNILVKKGSLGQAPIITFVDFGMVGSLTQPMQRYMKEVVLAYLTRNSRSLVRALSRLGFIGEGADLASLEQAMSLLIERYHRMTLGEVSEMDLLEMLQDLESLLYEHQFHIPAQFAFSGRAIGTLAGVATGLAPDFNFVEVAAPYARTFLGLHTGEMGEIVQQLLSQVLETVNTLLKMPRSIEGILTKLERGQFVMNLGGDIGLGATALRRRERKGATTAFPIAVALMFVACLAGAYFFDAQAHDHLLAIVSLLLAAILGIRLFLRW